MKNSVKVVVIAIYLFSFFESASQKPFSIKLENCDSIRLSKTEFSFAESKVRNIVNPVQIKNDFYLKSVFNDFYADLVIQTTFSDSLFLYKRLFIPNNNSGDGISISCLKYNYEGSKGIINFGDFLDEAYDFSKIEAESYWNRKVTCEGCEVSYDSLLIMRKEANSLKSVFELKQLEFLRQNRHKLESLILLDRIVERRRNLDSELYAQTFELLDEKLRLSKLGSNLKGEIENKVNRYKNLPTVGRKNEIRLEQVDLQGNKVDLQSKMGSKVLLTFWATWCKPCVADVPFLKQIHEKYPDIYMVSLSEDKDINVLRSYIEKNNIDWPQLIINQEIKNDFNIDGIPVSILIDEGGFLKKNHVGGMNYLDYEKFIFE